MQWKTYDPEAAKALVARVNDQHAEPLQALTSAAAYARIGGMSLWMSALGQFIAVTIALGAVFGGMNTMFSAVAHRRREIGILRTVGYRPFAILASFLFESLLLAAPTRRLSVRTAERSKRRYESIKRLPLDRPRNPMRLEP